MTITGSDAIESLCASIPDAPGPEDIDANLRFREKIAQMGDASPDFAAAFNLKCSRDPVFWMNVVAWTKNPKDFPTDPTRPVVLFPNQAEYVWWLHDHVERGESGLLRKSREQLASVATSNYLLWRLIYCENSSALVGSYKEDVVDGVSYAKSILPKIDFTISRMRDWMLPAGYNKKKPGPHRKHMALLNPVTGMAIEGETCNDDFARGGRFAVVWIDEIAHVGRQEDIHTAVGNATNCFVYTTTPKGMEMFASMVESGDHDVFTLHWTNNYLWHPIDPDTGVRYPPSECTWDFNTRTGKWPEKFICSQGCKAHPMGGWPHSQRYDKECKKYNWDAVRIAQELDINPLKAGSAVFDQDKVLMAIKHLSEHKPEFRYYKLHWKTAGATSIDASAFDFDLQWFKQAGKWGVIAEQCEGGPFKVWKEPFSCRDRECACKGTGLHTYVLGGDTCCNVDRDYHCAYIWDATAGECVAEWHGRGESKKIALEWAKICKWYGGSSKDGWPHAYASVEANNEGGTFNDTLDKIGIVVHVNRNESNMNKKATKRLGVFLDRWNKPIIINDHLQPEISTADAGNELLPRLVVPFMDFWKECQTFVYKYNTKQEMRPENAKMEAQTRKHHDDRVMAMAHAIYGCTVRFGKIRGFVAKNAMARHQMWKEERQERAMVGR